MLQRQHAENAGHVAQNEGENDAVGGESFEGSLICGHRRAEPFSFLFQKLAVGREVLLNFALNRFESLKTIPCSVSVHRFLTGSHRSLMGKDYVCQPVRFSRDCFLKPGGEGFQGERVSLQQNSELHGKRLMVSARERIIGAGDLVPLQLIPHPAQKQVQRVVAHWPESFTGRKD